MGEAGEGFLGVLGSLCQWQYWEIKTFLIISHTSCSTHYTHSGSPIPPTTYRHRPMSERTTDIGQENGTDPDGI